MPPQVSKTPDRLARLKQQGQAIGDARRSKNLSQPQAAQVLETTLGALRMWEHGRRACPPATRLRIADLWGGDREALGIGEDYACPCCGRPFS